MRTTDNEFERLEEEIKENVEWLYTTEDDEVECIGIENLEAILTRFFGTKIDLIQK
tara:strand:+ start:85 stop:252 length:168 start_codon:yes stop_codon:yes gene_type:complete